MDPSIIALLLFITLVFFIIYYALILRLHRVWNTSTNIIKNNSSHESLFVSIILAGRNESRNLKECINSILDNDYAKSDYEVIYIDDHSEDNSLELLESIDDYNFRFYELKDHLPYKALNSYKKAALNLGISSAKGQIILLTDADTIVNKSWIKTHVEQYYTDTEVKMCTAPVIYFNDNNFIEKFQYYDLLATMGFTHAGIADNSYFMANGANMSFLKEIYNPNTSNPQYASGDDMFFIQRIAKRYPESTRFIKSKKASVFTYPEKTMKSFLSQRLRWGTKSRAYSDTRLKAILAIVFFTNLMIIIDIIPFGIFSFNYISILMVLIFLKLIVDTLFISSVAREFKQNVNYLSLVASLIIYPFYIVPMGILSLFVSKYYWKGRMVK